MDVTVIGKDDIERLKDAVEGWGTKSRIWAKDATEPVAKVIVEMGRRNLEARAGGGKYTRADSSVELLEDDTGFAAGLFTPFLGIEFGGWITNVAPSNAPGGFARIGSDRAKEIGLEPMWAPWHGTSAKGYIIGSVWTELDKGDASAAMAEGALAAWKAEADMKGVPNG